MEALLDEFQYELDGYVFGVGQPVEVTRLDPGPKSWRTQRQDAPNSDGRFFGRDYATASTWGMDLYVNQQEPDVAFDVLEEAAAVFEASEHRDTPGATSVLRYCLPGRTRRVYGRTARWSAPPTNGVLVGYIPITADFECADSLFYDDVLESRELSLVANESSGLVEPLVEPLSTVGAPTERAGRFTVGGRKPTWATVTFHGPVSNPRVQIGDWTIALQGTLAADMTVTVDPRPWVRTVLYGGAYSGSAAELLPRRVYLDQMRLAPGSHEAVFTGADATGTARATVSWRAAYGSM